MSLLHRVLLVCAVIVGASAVIGLARRRTVRLAALVGCFLFVGFLFSLGVIDDAYISLRYARNFANGDGVVFNCAERVEGYTCFLWVLLLGTIKKLFSRADLVALARYLGVCFGALAIGTLNKFSTYLSDRTIDDTSTRRSIPFALLLVAANFPLIFWSFSGMETTFYVFLIVMSTYFFSKYLLEDDAPLPMLLYASVFQVFACMTRPETYLLPVCSLAFIAAREKRAGLRAVAIFLVPFLVIFLPYFIWRYKYFGYLFPNTYYAKVGGGSLGLSLQGLTYLKNGAIPHLTILAFVVGKMVRRRQTLTIADYYLLSIIAIWVVTIVYTGADHFIELRFFVYMLPFMYLFALDEIGVFADGVAGRISRVFRSRHRPIFGHAAIMIISLTTFLALFYYNSMGVASTERFGRHLADSWGLLGKWLQQNTEVGDVIATPVVGAIGYYCNRTIVDMLGIVDPVIAHGPRAEPGQGPKDHDRYDSEYVLSRKPQYIYLLSFAPTEKAFLQEKSWIPAIEDLKRHFPNRHYEYGVVRIGPHYYGLYRRLEAK